MDRVHANTQELEKFAARLRHNSESIIALAQQLEQTLTTIDWDDSVKRRIDQDVRQATVGLKGLSKTLDNHSREVGRKANQLRDFLQH